MKDLAFKISNELLNRGWIVSSVQPFEMEDAIATILESNLPAELTARKTHFSHPNATWALCGTEGGPNTIFEERPEDVTCKRCRRSLYLRGKLKKAQV